MHNFRVNKIYLIQSIHRFMIQYSGPCIDAKHFYERVCLMESTHGVVQLFEISEMEQGGV
jgi:hypothetical protein